MERGGRGKDLIYGETGAETLVGGGVGEVEFFAEFDEESILAVERDVDGVGAIAGLLFIGGPAAVGGFVVAVVIDAVDGVKVGGSGSHVGEEVMEGFAPAGADFDADVGEELGGAVAPGDHGGVAAEGVEGVFDVVGFLWHILHFSSGK